jgi:hypothetical protein
LAAGITFLRPATVGGRSLLFEEAQANGAKGTHYRLAITGNTLVCTVPYMQNLFSDGKCYISKKPEIY